MMELKIPAGEQPAREFFSAVVTACLDNAAYYSCDKKYLPSMRKWMDLGQEINALTLEHFKEEDA